MLRSLGKITGFTVLAKDGEIGEVEDFYFDDEDWRVRYIVVDTGRWLPGKKVLIIPDSFKRPLWDEKKLPVTLTREQVKNSPDIDTKRPITRRHEEELHKYYGWDTYWAGSGTLPGTDIPVAPPELIEMVKERGLLEGGKELPAGDSHLQSFEDVKGWSINALDGEIGRADDFLAEDDDWQIRYLVVNTGGWIPLAKRTMVSPQWIKSINVDDKTINTDLPKDLVNTSPKYDPDHFDRTYEVRLYLHYDKPGYWTRRKAA